MKRIVVLLAIFLLLATMLVLGQASVGDENRFVTPGVFAEGATVRMAETAIIDQELAAEILIAARVFVMAIILLTVSLVVVPRLDYHSPSASGGFATRLKYPLLAALN